MTTPSTAIDAALLQRVEALVREAGEIIRQASTRPKTIRLKGAIDLVTETDLAVELFLKERLAALLPGSDFLAEETAAAARLGELTWIIDPVDGTTNFAHGFPFVATSVGLWHRDQVVLGVVNAPLLGECFTALAGAGARCNGQPIHVSAVGELSASLVATGFPYNVAAVLPHIQTNLGRMLANTQGVRRPGAASIDLAYVAAGRYEAYYEIGLKPWDTAAGWLLVREAGGRVTGFDPAEPYRLGAPGILASNGLVHEAVGQLLEAPPGAGT